MDLELLTDPADFLEAAADHLAATPVLATVVATVASRSVSEVEDGIAQDPRHWYAVARHGDAVVGVGMRTAPHGDRPAYLLPMPDEAARLLARTVHERGEDLAAVNGALPAVQVFADELGGLSGRTPHVWEHTRLHELAALVEPAPVPGALRPAGRADLEVCRAWFSAFHRDADEQAGRPPGRAAVETFSDEDLLRRIDGGRIWLWEDGGEVVHLTGANAPAFGVARVGPVYTPRERRGRGYASAAVAQVTRLVVDQGARACLFTDLANPTSNRIYAALGYRPVVDMAHVVLR
ncbi:GNAT family N-acetyltransferase [Nocardioides sp. P5_C9_2]